METLSRFCIIGSSLASRSWSSPPMSQTVAVLFSDRVNYLPLQKLSQLAAPITLLLLARIPKIEGISCPFQTSARSKELAPLPGKAKDVRLGLQSRLRLCEILRNFGRRHGFDLAEKLRLAKQDRREASEECFSLLLPPPSPPPSPPLYVCSLRCVLKSFWFDP